jgi:hypothetical protein
MEAFTSLGSYDHMQGGHLVCWDDNIMFELRPGATILIPAGSKQFSFVSVAPHETRFLFRQYCSAAVFRWIDKRGYADTEAIEQAPADPELAMALVTWEEMRARRGREGLQMFARLQDLYV